MNEDSIVTIASLQILSVQYKYYNRLHSYYMTHDFILQLGHLSLPLGSTIAILYTKSNGLLFQSYCHVLIVLHPQMYPGMPIEYSTDYHHIIADLIRS